MMTGKYLIYAPLFTMLCFGLWSCDFSRKARPAPPLPDVYSEVPSLDSLALQATSAVRLFSRDSLNEFQICHVDSERQKIYLQGHNYTDFSSTKPQNYAQRYYRLNSMGEVEDSLVFREDSLCRVYGPYLVNFEKVYSWMKDGKKEGLPIVGLNEDLDLDSTERAVYEVELYSKASVAINRSVRRGRKSLQSSFFIVNNTGYDVLEGNTLRWDGTGSLPVKGFLMNDRRSWYSAPHDSVFAGKNKDLSLRYFHKESYHKQRSSGAFNPISQTFPAKWEGKAFMDLSLNNATWSFYISMNQLERDSLRFEQKRRDPIQFFRSEAIGLAIFGLNDGKLYFFDAK